LSWFDLNFALNKAQKDGVAVKSGACSDISQRTIGVEAFLQPLRLFDTIKIS